MNRSRPTMHARRRIFTTVPMVRSTDRGLALTAEALREYLPLSRRVARINAPDPSRGTPAPVSHTVKRNQTWSVAAPTDAAGIGGA